MTSKAIKVRWALRRRLGIDALRRMLALRGRRLAVLWRIIAGPGRRVRLPRRPAV